MVQYRKPTVRSEDIIDRRAESTAWSIKAGRAAMAAAAVVKLKSLPGAGSDDRVTKAMREIERLQKEALARAAKRKR